MDYLASLPILQWDRSTIPVERGIAGTDSSLLLLLILQEVLKVLTALVVEPEGFLELLVHGFVVVLLQEGHDY